MNFRISTWSLLVLTTVSCSQQKSSRTTLSPKDGETGKINLITSTTEVAQPVVLNPFSIFGVNQRDTLAFPGEAPVFSGGVYRFFGARIWATDNDPTKKQDVIDRMAGELKSRLEKSDVLYMFGDWTGAITPGVPPECFERRFTRLVCPTKPLTALAVTCPAGFVLTKEFTTDDIKTWIKDQVVKVQAVLAVVNQNRTPKRQVYFQVGNEVTNSVFQVVNDCFGLPRQSVKYPTATPNELEVAELSDPKIIETYNKFYLTPAIAGIREADSGAKIVLGSFAGTNDVKVTDALRVLLDSNLGNTTVNVKDSVDIVSGHYPFNTFQPVPPTFDWRSGLAAIARMRQMAKPKPLWITEELAPRVGVNHYGITFTPQVFFRLLSGLLQEDWIANNQQDPKFKMLFWGSYLGNANQNGDVALRTLHDIIFGDLGVSLASAQGVATFEDLSTQSLIALKSGSKVYYVALGNGRERKLSKLSVTVGPIFGAAYKAGTPLARIFSAVGFSTSADISATTSSSGTTIDIAPLSGAVMNIGVNDVVVFEFEWQAISIQLPISSSWVRV